MRLFLFVSALLLAAQPACAADAACDAAFAKMDENSRQARAAIGVGLSSRLRVESLARGDFGAGITPCNIAGNII
jgi:hypothetical protein